MAHGSEDSGRGSAGGTAATPGVDGAVASPRVSDSPDAASPGLGSGASTAAVASTGTPAAATPLESLTPSYDEGHHGTYLRRLEEAVKDPRNLNIALTGRYGAGKSSVLDKFQANHRKTTQRLAISTLAPGEEGETTTNRIQKEIVKQLLYGASERVGKNSRFRKIDVLGKRKAFGQSAAVVACVAGILYLLDRLPHIKWTDVHHPTWTRVAAWAAAALLTTIVVSVVRVLTYGRLTVSEVSTGGATVSLAEKPDSFFDKFLDEIVYYFSRESNDIVVFEDLDRFEDPHIFEALRELNILLNETPERRARNPAPVVGWLLAALPQGKRAELATTVRSRWARRLLGLGVPLRFVYAVRDSVFEKIDATTGAARPATDSEPADDAAGAAAATQPPAAAAPVAAEIDAAAAETLRANRTKFFDIVIPLVPFISHRNARDLLLKLLAERGITGIEPRLVNTVAQHCTDMRLMRNMCNEYLVFAERLLEPKAPNKTAPGLDASHLFALVAYKSFHLQDFENIARRDSDLDRLYALHQRLVRDAIAAKDARKRALLAAPGLVRTRAQVAERLGKRVNRYAELVVRSRYPGYSHEFAVGSSRFGSDKVDGYEFWASVAQAQTLKIKLVGQTNVVETLDRDALEVLVPEGLDAYRWAAYDQTDRENEQAGIERAIVAFRRADFAQLVDMPELKVMPDPARPGTTPEPETFAELLETTLKSELARDLVRRGYIDRNFSLYAAQFYGNFSGVDVANFMVQHVQTNTMAVDYDLSRADAVANLLAETEEAGDDLEHTVAAYNINIVNHLLARVDPRAGVIADNLIAGWAGDASRTFLARYFTSAIAEPEKLAALLAEHRWREVFTYLVSDDDVPANMRVALVSAAMCAFDPQATYDLGDDVRAFITANYHAMGAFTDEHPVDTSLEPAERVPERLDVLLDRTSVVIPTLAAVCDSHLRKLIVAANRYELTADNLRSALGVSGDVSLDQVQDNDTVYAYCLDEPGAYLAAVRQDPATDYAVNSSDALVKLLIDVVDRWDEDQNAEPSVSALAELLAGASPSAQLSSLRAVPAPTWTELAATGLFRASLSNVEDYRAHVRSIDAHLAALLKADGAVHVDEVGDTLDEDGNEYDRQAAAIAILNVTTLDSADRVHLAASLGAPVPLPVDDIDADSGHLFALLLDGGMVADDEAAFEHFRDGGWDAIGPAIAASSHIATFIKPELVKGMVPELLADPAASAKVGGVVVADIEGYVPDDDWAALRAAVRYVDARGGALGPDVVVRAARVGHDHGELDAALMVRLLSTTSPAASADHIFEVFSRLKKPYSDISRSGAKPRFDRDDIHDRLLRVLRDAGRISRRTARTHYVATVL